jgi:hypothetical protein
MSWPRIELGPIAKSFPNSVLISFRNIYIEPATVYFFFILFRHLKKENNEASDQRLRLKAELKSILRRFSPRVYVHTEQAGGNIQCARVKRQKDCLT